MKLFKCKPIVIPDEAVQIEIAGLNDLECERWRQHIARWTGKDVIYDGIGFVVVACNLDGGDAIAGNGDWLIKSNTGHVASANTLRLKKLVELEELKQD